MFELGDAMLCTSFPVASVPALSLEPVFRRSHGSLYKSLDEGRVEETELRRLLIANRPFDWPMIFAVDGSTFDRCDAGDEVPPSRAFPPLASSTQLDSPSWRDGTTSGSASSTGHLIVGQHRQMCCASRHTWTQRQQRSTRSSASSSYYLRTARCRCSSSMRVMTRLPSVTDSARRAPKCAARIRDDRVRYPDPPARPNRPFDSGGRPPRHGKRFKCSDPNTWPKASDRLVVADRRYGNVTVEVWHGMHLRLWCRGYWSDFDVPPIVKGSVIRVEVEHLPKPTARAKKTLWLWWSGEGEHPISIECGERIFGALISSTRFDF